MLRFKPDVRIRDYTEQLGVLFLAASRWSLLVGIEVEVNSVDDGAAIHQADTLHGWSLAADLDTVGDARKDTASLAAFLRRVLPIGWDIVDEDDHVHAEWDTHRPPLRRST